MMKAVLLFLPLLFCCGGIVFAQTAQPTILEKRAAEVAAIINAPENLEKTFAPDFLAAVPPAKFAEISKSLTDNYGKALKVVKITVKSEYSGEIEILFEKNYVAKINVGLVETPPHLINGLLVTGIEKTSNSLEEIVGELKKLPGKAAFTAVKLNDRDFSPVIAYNADQPLAIGSTLKLYILSELVRSIAAGERKWSDVIELTEQSLPSGQMQNWAQGSPVTLHTLAAMMISISDNTATDQLIETLGREKIEKMLTVTGNKNPDLSIPFLKTVEMFKLKGATKENYAKTYLEKDISDRRAMLAGEIAAFNKDDIDFKNFLTKPTYISQLEWFASPNDLARLMNWLRLNSEKSPADKARGILTINKALPEADAKNWNYVGYKGGSETGVINLTYLLQSKKGEWFVVSGGWNDENAAVKNDEFALLMQKAVKILQEQTQ